MGKLVIGDNRTTMYRARLFDDTRHKRELTRLTTLDDARSHRSEPALTHRPGILAEQNSLGLFIHRGSGGDGGASGVGTNGGRA